jgi:hypothetical protein
MPFCYNARLRYATFAHKERPMNIAEKPITWVVYEVALQKASGCHAVCEQSEWEEMESARPGFHTLIQAGINSEGAAEKLARAGQTSETKRPARLKVR